MLRKNDPMVNRSGFTLIELVVVLMIIAVIAGLIIPQVAMLGRTADMAATAKTQADLNNNIQLHFVQLKRFPQGFDSLLNDTGGSGTPSGVIVPADIAGAALPSTATDADQYSGLPINGSDVKIWQASHLAMATLPNDGTFNRSLQRCGFDWVYDHETARSSFVPPGNANGSGRYQRAINTGAVAVAELLPTSALAVKLFPNGVPPSSRLVCFGVGQRCSLVPKTMNQAPIYPGNDGRYYGHYIAVFQLYDTGERATLVGVIDAYGRTTNYTIDQYHQSLPDGGRQG